jgi:hypothetical protein
VRLVDPFSSQSTQVSDLLVARKPKTKPWGLDGQSKQGPRAFKHDGQRSMSRRLDTSSFSHPLFGIMWVSGVKES